MAYHSSPLMQPPPFLNRQNAVVNVGSQSIQALSSLASCLGDNSGPEMRAIKNPEAQGANVIGQVTYACSAVEDCSFAFSRPSDLKRHVETIHLKSKSFWCPVDDCDRTVRPFPRKDKRNEHFRKVHKGLQIDLQTFDITAVGISAFTSTVSTSDASPATLEGFAERQFMDFSPDQMMIGFPGLQLGDVFVRDAHGSKSQAAQSDALLGAPSMVAYVSNGNFHDTWGSIMAGPWNNFPNHRFGKQISSATTRLHPTNGFEYNTSSNLAMTANNGSYYTNGYQNTPLAETTVSYGHVGASGVGWNGHPLGDSGPGLHTTYNGDASSAQPFDSLIDFGHAYLEDTLPHHTRDAEDGVWFGGEFGIH